MLHPLQKQVLHSRKQHVRRWLTLLPLRRQGQQFAVSRHAGGEFRVHRRVEVRRLDAREPLEGVSEFRVGAQRLGSPRPLNASAIDSR